MGDSDSKEDSSIGMQFAGKPQSSLERGQASRRGARSWRVLDRRQQSARPCPPCRTPPWSVTGPATGRSTLGLVEVSMVREECVRDHHKRQQKKRCSAVYHD
ncbi:hypothetical protein DPEC_G00139090 [Dallia pectoralis]|uniref:Uncharacterized protein n=1 Tax=Dallia pectoralis TaxID=75939 RepID=A0ACC2GM57_DALPE|nr:hypothetical protein DPEC_G00139090 [Dallia pectoralis]